jgi:uncharacterized membrane protein YgcG
MKAIALIQRRHRHRAAPAVSLFAFLAVLICTMGALMLLLLAVTREAKLQAASEVAAKAAKQESELAAQRELVQWRIGQLKTSRKTTESQLSDARLALGHVEDHARRLADQLRQLRAVAAGHDLAAIGGSPSPSRLESQLEQIQGAIADARRGLATVQEQAKRRSHCYAIIPYQGPNQTHRRPIYLECRADVVVVQPEGIELGEADFEGPSGAGNPLAAALRAAREYLVNRGTYDPQRDGEPYPLLLVRPHGIGAYYAARDAMQWWESDFGYELISEDWKLQFPPPDPQLAQVMQREIDLARARLALAPGRHIPQTSTYHASPGGIVREGGGGDANGPTAGGFPAGGVAGGGTSPGGFANGGVAGNGTSAGGFAAGGVAGGGTSPGGFAPGGVPGGGTSPGGFASGGVAGNGTPTGGSVPAGAPGSGTPAGGSASAGVPRPDGFVAGQPVPETDRPMPPRSADAGPGALPRPGEWQPHELYAPKPDDDNDEKDKDHKSLAKTRGRDWALRDANHKSTPITRHIRVECYNDRLVIVPEGGAGTRKEIPLGPRTVGSIDKFIAAVWEQMDSWGMAGNGMYWHPVLNVSVAPGAQQRFDDFRSLLKNSGLTVERTQ